MDQSHSWASIFSAATSRADDERHLLSFTKDIVWNVRFCFQLLKTTKVCRTPRSNFQCSKIMTDCAARLGQVRLKGITVTSMPAVRALILSGIAGEPLCAREPAERALLAV